MTQSSPARLRVSPAVARVVARDASRELRLAAARGALELTGHDLVMVLYLLCHDPDPELRGLSLQTVRTQPGAVLAACAAEATTPPQLLHFLAQVRPADSAVVRAIVNHSATTETTYSFLAGHCSGDPLKIVLGSVACWRTSVAVLEALKGNPHLDPALRERLMKVALPPTGASATPAAPPAGTVDAAASADDQAEAADTSDEEENTEAAEEELNASKYQQALEMGVSEKIKMALTGDKEWRSIFLKDPNKLVHGAAIKNPRITDGEVLAIAKNKASSEELIRAILLNKEWVKNPLIRAALVTQPKTPAPQALRFLPSLPIKELKVLSKSKGVSQVLVNAARRLVADKDKKK